MKKQDKASNREKLVKLFENVSKVDMKKFKEYIDSKPLNENFDINENPMQPEVAPAPTPGIQPQTLPKPAPTTTPSPKPNPFAPSIEPDAEPKGMAEEAQQGSAIDVLAKKLSDEIAATYNKNKTNVAPQAPAQGDQAPQV